jgi:capsular exopolysaccharide synthesis family protein
MDRQQRFSGGEGGMFHGRRSTRKRTHPLEAHYQSLLTQIYRRNGEKMRSIGVIACGPGEGTSVIAANLGIMAAGSISENVLLVDAHVRRPSLAQGFAVTPQDGFTEVAAGAAQALESICDTPVPNLKLLGPGKSAGGPLDALRVGQIFRELEHQFGYIVVDLPPATEVGSSGCVLASLLDGVVLVVESERTRTQVLRSAKERLARESANVLGAILNKRQHHIPSWLYERI